MKDKTSTKAVGNDGPNKGDSTSKHVEADVLKGLKATPPETSGETLKPEPTGRRVQDGEEISTDEKEPLNQALAFFMLELGLGLRTINKLNEAAYAEFDRITSGAMVSQNTIDVSELHGMNAFLELLQRELQPLGEKARIMADRFRNSLLDAGVDGTELEESTKLKTQVWPSDKADRLKEVTAKLSKKEMAIRTQLMITFTTLCTLHEVLETIRKDRGPLVRIDELGL